MLVRKPNRKELKPATAAVAVIRLRLTSDAVLAEVEVRLWNVRALFAYEVLGVV